MRENTFIKESVSYKNKSELTKEEESIMNMIKTSEKRRTAGEVPLYADNFPVWANHANAMLQIALWGGLRDLHMGASLQHYNPIIDKADA